MAGAEPVLVLYCRRVPSKRGLAVEMLANWSGAIRPVSADGAARTWWQRLLDRNSYVSLSYVDDWLQAFLDYPGIAVTALNIADLAGLWRAQAAVREHQVIVILHSAAGDDLGVVRMLSGALQQRRGRVVVFFGNEYTKMREKIAFAREIAADAIASQLAPVAAAWLYAECPHSTILHAPAALNPGRYAPLAQERSIDIGFRGDRYPVSIGDELRTRVIEAVAARAPAAGLSTDIRFERIPGPSWNAFLNRCQGVVGAEAGTAYLERDDATERAVRDYLQARPHAGFEEIAARFFDCHRHAVSGKAISSRHFEAIGTRTCQVLLEGHYNGILQRDVHYVGVSHDLSDLDDSLRRFADPVLRSAVTDAAWSLVMSAHTYRHRVGDVLAGLGRAT